MSRSIQVRVVVVLAGLSGCMAAPAPAAVPIVGPDGTSMMHVSCGLDEARCYEIAGRSCPAGYDIARTAGNATGNFLVRCRAPVPAYAPPAYATYAPPQRYVPPVYAPSPVAAPAPATTGEPAGPQPAAPGAAVVPAATAPASSAKDPDYGF